MESEMMRKRKRKTRYFPGKVACKIEISSSKINFLIMLNQSNLTLYLVKARLDKESKVGATKTEEFYRTDPIEITVNHADPLVSVETVLKETAKHLAQVTDGSHAFRLGQGLAYWTSESNHKTQGFSFVTCEELGYKPSIPIIKHQSKRDGSLHCKTNYFQIIAFPEHPDAVASNISESAKCTQEDAAILLELLNSKAIAAIDCFLPDKYKEYYLQQVSSNHAERGRVENLSIAALKIHEIRIKKEEEMKMKKRKDLEEVKASNPMRQSIDSIKSDAKRMSIQNSSSKGRELADEECEIIGENPNHPSSKYLSTAVVANSSSRGTHSVNSSAVTIATIQNAADIVGKRKGEYYEAFLTVLKDENLEKQMLATMGVIDQKMKNHEAFALILADAATKGMALSRMFDENYKLVQNWQQFLPKDIGNFISTISSKHKAKDLLVKNSSRVGDVESNNNNDSNNSNQNPNEHMLLLQLQIELFKAETACAIAKKECAIAQKDQTLAEIELCKVGNKRKFDHHMNGDEKKEAK